MDRDDAHPLDFSAVFEDEQASGLVDPVTYEIMRHPVRATGTGEVYDDAALARYNNENDNVAAGISPLTGTQLGAIVAAEDKASQLAELRLRLHGSPKAAASAPAAATGGPGQADATQVRSIEDVAGIFRCLDEMRPVLGDMLAGWEPPRIVVIGSTSVGKSTLLERLAMMPLFPRQRGVCTRVPIHLRLRRCAPEDSHARLAVLNTATREEQPPDGRMIAIDSGWREVSQRMTEMLADAGARAVSGTHAIVLTVHHSSVPLIDLVDLPGVQSDTPASRELTEGIIRAHVGTRASDMYLLVTKWTTGCRTQDAGGLLFLDDETKTRTVGVLTHCDKVRDAEDREWLCSIIQREPEELVVEEHGIARLAPNGWVAVASAEPVSSPPAAQGQPQPTAGLQRLLGLRRSELAHFGSDDDLRRLVDEGSATCDALVQRLETMYLKVLEDEWLPDTLGRLREHTRERERQLLQLGLPVQPTDDEARAEVDRLLLQGYTQLVDACVLEVLEPLRSAARRAWPDTLVQMSASELGAVWRSREWLLRMLMHEALDDLLAHWTHGLRKLVYASSADETTPFRIARFGSYAELVVDCMRAVAVDAINKASAACDAILERTFDASDGAWLHAAFMDKCACVQLHFDSIGFADAVLASCVLPLPSLEVLQAAHRTATALGSERESCGAERTRLEEQCAQARAAGAELCVGVCRATLMPLCGALETTGAELLRRPSIKARIAPCDLERVLPGLVQVAKFNDSLTQLDLYALKLGDQGVSSLANALSVNGSITTLGLYFDDNIGDQGMSRLADALRVNCSITTLNLHSRNFGGQGMSSLADALRVNGSIKALELGGVNDDVGDQGMSSLADALRVNGSITTLCLPSSMNNMSTWNYIGDQGISRLADALHVNCSITTLNLHSWNLGEQGMSSLADALRVNGSITTLCLHSSMNNIGTRYYIGDQGMSRLADALHVNCSITTLDLLCIGAKGMSSLANALRVNCSITSLRLWGDDEGVPSLASALLVNGSITTLGLRMNNFGDHDVPSLADALRIDCSITTLSLWAQNIGDEGVSSSLADALRTNTSITTLNLDENYIGEQGVSHLADALRVNCSITTLNLGWNNIGDQGVSSLAGALRVNSSITALKLDCNDIGDQGVSSLADALHVNSSITTLNLDFNNIGDQGMSSLADALHVNSSITTLNLDENCIGDDGVSRLVDALRVNSSITTLDIVSGNNIGDEGEAALKEALLL